MKKRQNIDHSAWEAVITGAVEINDREHLRSRVDRGERLRVTSMQGLVLTVEVER